LAEPHHVVVDVSNLATEGRTLPSLKQLDEAVRAYAAEDPDASIIVVVDATFEHRVSDEERDEVRAAMLNGEVISPPAGAIGRGDAFVLRIAERTGAVVLSNDSFQEFHGEHPWLFDEGRLIGGKPVPGVGWIFTPRIPIRGPKSRAATAEAKSKRKDPDSAPAKAAELARAAKKAAKRGSRAKKATSQAVSTVDSSWPIKPTVPPPGRVKVDPVLSSAIEEAVEEALHPVKPSKSKGSTKKAAPPKSAKAKKAAPTITPAAAKATSRSNNKRATTPPPAVNEPLAFINFVASFAVGTTVEGEVVSFTSHGAMVDVAMPQGGVLHCYIPLTAMGTPPPTKARQVLKKGELRPFVLAGLDPPRRVAELSLPTGSAAAPGGVQKQTSRSRGRAAAAAATDGSRRQASGDAKSADGKRPKAAAAKKATGKKAAKKSAPQKTTAKKAAAAKKAVTATAKSATPVKKAPAKKATAKKAAVKATSKKAAAKKAAKAKKAPAKKAAKAART
jgi:hypothetical protein